MIKALYCFYKADETELPFKRGDTLQVLWESDPNKEGEEGYYTLFLVSPDGETLENKKLEDVIEGEWSTFVDRDGILSRNSRNRTIEALGEAGLLPEELVNRVANLSFGRFLDVLEELQDERDTQAANEARQNAEPTVEWNEYLAGRGESADL
jgi:hypothetical protein